MSTVVNLHTYTVMDYSYSRHSNRAGAPLPHIPRRVSSSRSSVAVHATSVSAPSSPPALISRIVSVEATQPETSAVPTVLVVQPSPPQDSPVDEVSSSSSGSESYVQMNPRAKRVRTPKMNPFRSPAESTPTPAVMRAKSAPGANVAFHAPVASVEDSSETPRASDLNDVTPRPILHLAMDTFKKPSVPKTHPLSVRASSNGSRTVSAPHVDAAKAARKKSGEPLKSSLKSRRPIVRGDLSVVTGLPSSKSEPNTPMKSVHFDAHLEHVKLFLAEQKPLAISREGSPTDTSGTESDFPSAIYGPKKSEGEEDKVLTMTVTNIPAAPRADADVVLEELTLSTDSASLNGRVRVRNIAFEKWVAVRFTVDWWQTTSEVTAKYHDSVPGGVFDRFTFSIRLGDMLARIEEKTMFFALRYNVAGREIWDNNGGQNYKVMFTKVAHPRSTSSPPSETNFASLKSKLENVVKGQETVGRFMAQESSSRSSRKAEPFLLEASTSLSERYDFAASWKSPWNRSPPMLGTPTKPSHARNITYPNALPQLPKRVGKQPMSKFDDSRTQVPLRGSPRIFDADEQSPFERPALFYALANAEFDDSPIPIMSRRRTRNHQRGYFDLGGLAQTSPSVKRTPPGTPTREVGLPTPSKLSVEVLKQMQAERDQDQEVSVQRGPWYVGRGGSEESTPSVTSNSESSQSSSPSGSPTEDRVPFGFEGLRSPESDSYSSFLNKYCYYTGDDDSTLDSQQGVIHRSHSASSVEEFLSTSPSLGYFVPSVETPTRSPSFDDVVSVGSGSTTPTMPSTNWGGFSGSPQLLATAH